MANFVLAACALTAPVLRGFAERAFPYSNLAGLEILEEVPGYIAGVTNPRFEDLPHTWDLLCNLETGRITVSKGLTNDGGDREMNTRTPNSADQASGANDTESLSGHASGPSNKEMRSYNPDTPDNIFMEEASRRGSYQSAPSSLIANAAQSPRSSPRSTLTTESQPSVLVSTNI